MGKQVSKLAYTGLWDMHTRATTPDEQPLPSHTRRAGPRGLHWQRPSRLLRLPPAQAAA